jgi:cephalosporin hydroxylase
VRSEGRATAALLPEIATGQKFARDFPASDAGGFREYDGDLWKYFSSHTQGPGIWKWEHYFDAYERHLSRFRGRAVTLVEIGIYSGGSLPMWRAYLGNDCQIYGVDIQPECIQYQSEGIHVVIGDQADRAFWRQFKQSVPHVDIVIDDGGHTYEQQRVTLEELFPHLRPGGVYICEDIHGMGNPFFGYLVGIAAALNDFQWDRTHRAIPLTGIAKYIEAIELRPYLAVITKHAAIRAQLVSRKQGTQWAPFPLR